MKDDIEDRGIKFTLHDPVYGGDWEMTSQLHALKYLKFCRGGDFIPNPWDEK